MKQIRLFIQFYCNSFLGTTAFRNTGFLNMYTYTYTLIYVKDRIALCR